MVWCGVYGVAWHGVVWCGAGRDVLGGMERRLNIGSMAAKLVWSGMLSSSMRRMINAGAHLHPLVARRAERSSRGRPGAAVAPLQRQGLGRLRSH